MRKAFHFLCLFYSVSLSSNLQPALLSRAIEERQHRFAYIQYATNQEYLCNSLMIFDSLHRLHSNASRVLIYPNDWTPAGACDPHSDEDRMLRQGC